MTSPGLDPVVAWGERELVPGVTLLHQSQSAALRFDTDRPVLSSAVLNGGMRLAQTVLNLRVPKASESEALEDPAETLARTAREASLPMPVVGMMTAASMKSLRVAQATVSQEALVVLVTTGLENARRAGDPAESRELLRYPRTLGTINMVVVCSAALAAETMVEMVMVATEAKAAVLQELGITSAVTEGIATGTGTDAIVVVGGVNGPAVRYAGKHTLLGEQLARLVMSGLRDSLAWNEGVAE